LSETVIKKSKAFKQSNFLRGFAKPQDSNQKVSVSNLGFCDNDVLMNDSDVVKEKTPREDEEETKDDIEAILPPLALSNHPSLGFY
jgi:hypothetical protein